MLLTMVTLMSLAADSSAWVVVSRRSGVARPHALEVARAVSARFSREGIRLLPPDDLTLCNGKVPCLMERGRASRAEAMVCLDIARVLDDQIVVASILLVEEDGRRLAQVQVEGPAARFEVDKLDVLLSELKRLAGAGHPTPDEDQLPVAPASLQLPPPPPPPNLLQSPVDMSTTATTSSASPRRTLGLITAGLGIGGLLTAGGFMLGALDAAGERARLCPGDAPCLHKAAFEAYDRAASAQNTSLVVGGISAGLLTLGAILFFTALNS